MWRQMTGSPLPRKGLTTLDKNESGEIVFEATSCTIICPEDPGDRVPNPIKGIARERLLDPFPGMCRLHVSGTAGVEASNPRQSLGNAVYETHDVRDQASKESRASPRTSFHFYLDGPSPLEALCDE